MENIQHISPIVSHVKFGTLTWDPQLAGPHLGSSVGSMDDDALEGVVEAEMGEATHWRLHVVRCHWQLPASPASTDG